MTEWPWGWGVPGSGVPVGLGWPWASVARAVSPHRAPRVAPPSAAGLNKTDYSPSTKFWRNYECCHCDLIGQRLWEVVCVNDELSPGTWLVYHKHQILAGTGVSWSGGISEEGKTALKVIMCCKIHPLLEKSLLMHVFFFPLLFWGCRLCRASQILFAGSLAAGRLDKIPFWRWSSKGNEANTIGGVAVCQESFTSHQMLFPSLGIKMRSVLI